MHTKQTGRLTIQHKTDHGVLSIFGDEAKLHDMSVWQASQFTVSLLRAEYKYLEFRHRQSISKKEINDALKAIDDRLGQTLFVQDANIKPDGGLIEVKDDKGNWRVIVVSEAKFQGKDIENIKAGIQVGKNNDQDIMVAGNAIERAHKNVAEIANYMLAEDYYPYVLFIEGSNFLTENIRIERPDGREVVLSYSNGGLNRLDRLTAANYGMPMNKNLCKNIYVKHGDSSIMLQAASIYTKGNGGHWRGDEMVGILRNIAETSLKALASDIFEQLKQRS